MVTIRTPDREQLREAAAARGMTVTDLIRQALAAQGTTLSELIRRGLQTQGFQPQR